MDLHNLVVKSRAAALAAALVLSLAPAARADATIDVSKKGDGVYEVTGRFTAPATAARAWDVLTDYDHLPAFVSSMRSSTSAPGRPGVTLVQQEAVGKAGPFSRTMYVALEVTTDAPRRIDFTDTSGRSFSTYVGSWTVEETAGGVVVSYRLLARPHSAPPLFARPIMAGNARELLEQVRSEIVRRQASR